MGSESSVTAFVPGHVTAFFSVHRRESLSQTGSRGAGITLTHGVEVAVTPAVETTVTMNGESVSPEPVVGTLRALGLDAEVTAETPLPAGAGFGVSGGLALGTALAANDVADLGRSENELVRAAHRAEVEAGTGLGDVVAQAHGGVPIRLEPGAPPNGSIDSIPATARVEYLSFGGLDTGSVITGDTDTLSVAGENALERLRDRPTLSTLFAAARDFARETGLLSTRVEAAVEDVQSVGGEACMAMLGETVIARETGLTDAGYDAVDCRIHPRSATLSRVHPIDRSLE